MVGTDINHCVTISKSMSFLLICAGYGHSQPTPDTGSCPHPSVPDVHDYSQYVGQRHGSVYLLMFSYYLCILRVSDQNGVSLLYIMLEIHHSGWEPSNYAVGKHVHLCKCACICVSECMCVCVGACFAQIALLVAQISALVHRRSGKGP